MFLPILACAFIALASGHSFDPYPDLYERNYLKKSLDETKVFAEGTENFRINDDAVPSFYK